MEAIMTDFQYKSIIKMALTIVEKSKDKKEAEEALANLLNEKSENKNSD